jgi:two-component system, NarL family, nitrate/nitrite response regulator NarL
LSEDGLVRILLIEDHVLLRESLARTLAGEADFVIAGQCGSVTEALEIVRAQPIDVVLLDLNLGVEQGGGFLNTCRENGFTGNVLVVTAGVGEREAAWLMRRGCRGIFLKHNPLAGLIARIREIAREDGPPAPVEPEETPARGGRVTLTARERDVLRCVCEGLASKEIAAKLEISESSVKSYLQQLFHKSGVRTRAQLVRVAIERFWDELGPG